MTSSRLDRRDRCSALSLAAVLLCLLAFTTGCRSSVNAWFPREADLAYPEARLSLDRLQEFFLIETEIEGLGPFPLVLDTGAGVLIVSDDIADSILRKKPRETTPFLMDLDGKEKEIGRVFKTLSVQIGPLHLRDTAVGSVDFSAWEEAIGRTPTGFIGVQVFRDLFVTIDFPKGEMWLREGPPADLPPAAASVPFRWILGSVVAAEISVAGRRVWTTIDSGSSIGLKVPRTEALPVLGEWKPWSILRDLRSTKAYSVAQLDADVTIGDTLLPKPWIYSSEEFAHTNVGMDLLQHFRMTLDVRNGRLWLEGPDAKRLVVKQPEPVQADSD